MGVLGGAELGVRDPLGSRSKAGQETGDGWLSGNGEGRAEGPGSRPVEEEGRGTPRPEGEEGTSLLAVCRPRADRRRCELGGLDAAGS